MSALNLPAVQPKALAKTLLVLALDTSLSMNSSGRIGQLNRGLPGFIQEMKKIPEFNTGGELLVVQFGTGGVAPVLLGTRVPDSTTSFVDVGSIIPETVATLTADGPTTPLGGALDLAMRELRARRAELAKAGVGQRGRSCLFVITDGEPTDHWQRSVALLREMEQAPAPDGNLLVFALGVDKAKDATLRVIAPEGTYSFAELPIEVVLKVVSIASAGAKDGRGYEQVRENVTRRIELEKKLRNIVRQQ